ncbi:MAG: sulfur carrier protein ThiS [Planctomycetota bacterium]|nr:sulfur carrier protein ThiS [Planctomycetota bacterium]
MKLTLNGEPKTLDLPDPTVAALVADLGLRPEVVAGELNGDLVPRASHATQTLAEGDRVEIVTLVGGG